jgi:DNA topoisomerase IA
LASEFPAELSLAAADDVMGALPIVPSAAPGRLSPGSNEYKLYDFIARWFMASCHTDSTVERAKVTLSLGAELFSCKYVISQEEHWLRICPWANDKIAKIEPLPAFAEIGAEFVIKSVNIVASGPEGPREVPIAGWLRPGQPAAESMHDIAALIAQGLVTKGILGFVPTARGVALVFALHAAGLNCGDGSLLDLTNHALAEIGAGNTSEGEKIMSIMSQLLLKIGENAHVNLKAFPAGSARY